MKSKMNKMKRYLQNECGSAALLTGMVLAGVFVTFVGGFISMSTHQLADLSNSRKDIQSLAAAQAATAQAFFPLKAGSIATFPYVYNNLAFENSNIGSLVSSVDVAHLVGTPYIRGLFNLKSIAETGGKRRGFEMRLQPDSFLRYSRFLQSGDRSYPAGSVVKGDVWVGGNLTLEGPPVTFYGNVTTTGSIINKSFGTFYKNLTENSTDIIPLDSNSVNLNLYRALVLGAIVTEGSGIYLPTSSVIDFRLFDFSSTPPKYNGVPLPVNFNGIIFVEGDATVIGNLEKRSLTVVASDDIVIADNIRSGNTADSSQSQNPALTFNSPKDVEQVQTVNINSLLSAQTTTLKLWVSGDKWKFVKMILKEGATAIGETELKQVSGSSSAQSTLIGALSLDPTRYSYTVEMHYMSTGSGSNYLWVEALTGQTISLGLVGRDYIYIDQNAPKTLTVDAYMLARDHSWKALGSSSDHPDGYTPGVWSLTFNGSIITKFVPSEAPYTNVNRKSKGITTVGKVSQNYDSTSISPPPLFPIPFERWNRISWRELTKSEM